MKKVWIAVLLLLASYAGATPEVCTNKGWYQRNGDLGWDFAPARGAMHPGDTFQGGSGNHALSVWGGDLAQYDMLEQCGRTAPCTVPLQGTHARPDDPIAAAVWDTYYIGPDSELKRHQFGHYNASFKVPSGVTHYNFIYIDQIPEPRRTTLKRANGCTLPPSTPPAATSTPVHTSPTATRVPTRPPSPGCCDPVGHGCPAGVPPCIKPSPTAVKTASPTGPPPTRTSTPSAPVTSTVTATMVPTAGASPTVVAPLPTGAPSGTPPTPSPTPGKGCGGKDGLLVGTLVALAGVGAYKSQKKKSSTTSVTQ